MGCESAREVSEIYIPGNFCEVPGLLLCARLRTADILLINFQALANEVAKNLVLAGIGSLTISDDQFVTDGDLGAQFFISEQHIGMNV